MNKLDGLAFGAALAAGTALARQSLAQDCDAMMGEIDRFLQITQIAEEEKQRVLDLRDEGMGETARARRLHNSAEPGARYPEAAIAARQ